MNSLPISGLYAITSNDDTLETIEAVLRAGAAMLQYREKLDPNPRHAISLKKLCDQYSTALIINDSPELALAANADGVHLGENDKSYDLARELLGKDSIIGVSCYDSLELALDAEKHGADYVAFGSFFSSKTKKNLRRADQKLLQQARDQLSIPIVAIGGITPKNAPALITAGADFIATIHSVFGQDNPGTTAKQFTDLFE